MKHLIGGLLGLPCLALALPAIAASPEDTGGKLILDARYRFEQVDQDNALDTAKAHTLRTRIGYRTPRWHGLSGLVEIDDVRHLGAEHFNDTRNGHAGYATVGDPEGTEVNQALIRYAADWGNAQVGRQRINLGNQRFVGGVGWRQNEQTYDGAMIELTPGAGWKLTYAYLDNINSVFGPDDTRPVSRTAPADIEGHSHLLQAQYAFSPNLTAIGYHYRLGLDNIAVVAGAPLGTLSSRTSGLRVQGKAGGFSYVLEHARQRELAGNPWRLDSRYWLAEAGYRWQDIQWKAGYEVLGAGGGGMGNRAFQTPLATKHAFQGWADQFLTTPADGLRDAYAGFSLPLGGGEWQTWYHDFRSDRGGDRFGRELDLSWRRAIPGVKGLEGLLKLASYRSSDATRTVDTDKFWVQVQYTY